MGNYVSCTLTKYSKSTRVVYPNGEIRKVRQPIKAAELISQNADEDLEIRNVYVMFPMNRYSSVVATADLAALFIVAKSGSKKIGSVRVLPEIAPTPPRLSFEDIEEVSTPEFKHMISMCRSKKPLLETIAEEPSQPSAEVSIPLMQQRCATVEEHGETFIFFCVTNSVLNGLDRILQDAERYKEVFVVARCLDSTRCLRFKERDKVGFSLAGSANDIQAEGMDFLRQDKKKNDKKGKGKSEYLAPKAGIVKQKFQGTCYNCDQPGHRAANYKMPKQVNPRQANRWIEKWTYCDGVCCVAMISEVNMDMWGEAILMATYLLNKIPRKEKEETPYELWMGRKPSYQYLRVWGCLAKVAVPTPKAQKIGPKSVDCIFIGYAKNNTAYRFIVHESKNPDIQKNTIMESRNASFFENIFPCLSKETGSSSRLDDKVVQDKRQRDDNDLQDERQDQTEEEEVEPRRSKRARNEKSFGPDFVSFMVENEPTSYREAVTSSEGQQWREAIKSEIESILQNHTWELVDYLPGCKA
ncbi:retrotransposon protein, putative, ty1-copia subclass [Tanacetum coccineum]